ncbi:MAG: c-type cytochrome [Planctomycetaceae bacterium]|nr:c-type cytochrome [Planctomycetaceae bacterium]
MMNLSRISSLLCVSVVLVSSVFGQEAANETGPFSPEQAVEKFVLHPDCRIELVASEPDVIDPVAMAFGPDGRLWVVEYSDYPNGPASGEPGRSRVRVLTDPDGDGRFSNPVTFKDKLLFANGLLPWKDGLIVTTNGQIVFFRDTDHDGAADEEQVWFQGFVTENPQLRCNDPTIGPDNKIYIANGLRGGSIVPGPGNPWGLDPKSEPVSISGMDFRFDPLTGEHEAISGPGQFGLTFDDWGNRFTCSNRNPCNHIVLENEDIRRVPWLRVTRVFHEASPAGENSRLYPLSRTWTTSNLHANQFTAACGVTIYRGDELPSPFYGNSFTCDPTANLVHRDVLGPNSVTFTSKPGRDKVEFLATKDEWFRPVNLAHGPDGALYLCDMYRAVIEHPQFMPEELKSRPDLLLGTDKGRLWRIVSARDQNQEPVQTNLAEKSSQELVEMLKAPNVWHRETARQLLLERQDKSVTGNLRSLILDKASTWGAPLAIRLLESMGELKEIDVTVAIQHPHGERQALELAHEFPGTQSAVQEFVKSQVANLDEAGRLPSRDPLMRSQIALAVDHATLRAACQELENHSDKAVDETLGFGEVPSIVRMATGLPVEMGGAVWTIHAGDQLPEFCREYLRGCLRLHPQTPSRSRWLEYYVTALGRRNHADEVKALLEDTAFELKPVHYEANKAVLLGLLAGLPNARNAIPQLVSEDHRDQYQTLVAKVVADYQGRKTLGHPSIDEVALLQLAKPEDVLPVLAELASSHDSETSLAALRLLRSFSQPEVGEILTELLPTRPPLGRREILSALATSPARLPLLLDQVEAGRVSPLEIDDSLRKVIARFSDKELVSRANEILKVQPPADRIKVLAEYQDCLSMSSDPLRGRAVFEKTCAVCHKIGDVGVNVAPDISDSRTKTPEFLLTNIIDPNRAIDNNYFSFTILDTDGRVHTGVIETETANSITLKQPEGKRLSIARDEIEEMKNNGVSLMPVGLEKTIDKQQMADLISFIKNWRYLDSSVPREVFEGK